MRGSVLRRAWLGLLVLALHFPSPLAAASSTAPPAPSIAEWQAFTRRYLAPEGRVIDTANGGISHSEGQGYAMVFAVHFDDRRRFDRMWDWTRNHLARPRDGLFAWRFDPNRPIPVSDPNNATDGDIFIAWALLMAAERWQEPEYRTAAERITTDILRCCITEVRGRMVMLPGAHGFRDATGVVVNLSYYAFPALRALSRAVPDRRWAKLERDGLALMNDGVFGRWRLPPDWLLLPANGGPPTPASRWPQRFSWDAVRVPLNLAWQRMDQPMLGAARRYWDFTGHPRRPPAWVDLRTGETAPYPGHAGIRAVHALVRTRFGEATGTPLRVADAPDYFGAALVLQTRIAPHMPLEAPPLVPRTPAAAPPGRAERLADAAQAAWNRIRPSEPEVEPVPAAQWARPAVAVEAHPVRGAPVGLRGLTPPR